ncbi:MAG: hypothetical protein ACRDPK_14070, partial [Carbonactinosporaceae bacterium]
MGTNAGGDEAGPAWYGWGGRGSSADPQGRHEGLPTALCALLADAIGLRERWTPAVPFDAVRVEA